MSAVPQVEAVPGTTAARRDVVNVLRVLAMDAVQKAASGHPGMPMGMAEIAEVLWRRHLRHNPANPAWPDRDRFVLSNGHGSMLLYALLHLSGYELPMTRAAALPSASLEDARPPGVWGDSWSRNHHRSVGSGHLQRSGYGHR